MSVATSCSNFICEKKKLPILVINPFVVISVKVTAPEITDNDPANKFSQVVLMVSIWLLIDDLFVFLFSTS